MFAAYSKSKTENKDEPSKEQYVKKEIPIVNETCIPKEEKRVDTLNEEVQNEFHETALKINKEFETETLIEKEREKRKKKKKHKDKSHHKKSKKRKNYSSSEESSSDSTSARKKQKYFDKNKDTSSLFARFVSNKTLEEQLCDEEYNKFMSKYSHNQLKSICFLEDFNEDIPPRNAFKIDKKGDKNNICFESVHFKQLCKYNLRYRDYNENVVSVSSKGEKKLSKKQIINEAHKKRYYSEIKNIKADEVSAAKTRDNKSEHLEQNTLSNKMWLYLAIKNQLEEEDEINRKDRISDYMKYLNENKTDVAKWLEFIEYQSKKNSKNFENSTDKQEANDMSFYERTVSIYERAIKENPNSFLLKIELIKYKARSIEMSNSYNAFEVVEKEFLNILLSESAFLNSSSSKINKTHLIRVVSNLFEIWFEYLKFLINSNSSDLMFNKVKKAFSKCFDFFLKNPNSWLSQICNEQIFKNNFLQLVDAYTSFLSKSGHIEKAIGVYQALLDFNFCANTKNDNSNYKNLNFKSRKALFELYWDIGLPKFGEKHSTGWLNCLDNREKVFEKLEDETTYRYDEFMDSFENKILNWSNIRIEYRWNEIERLRSIFYWYPFYPNIMKGESVDDCCDPDRLIAFDEDLSFILFDLNDDCFKFKLFCKFLKHLNLIDMNEEALDLKSSKRNESTPPILTTFFDEDGEYIRYLKEQIPFLNDTYLDKQSVPLVGGSLELLSVLYSNYFNPYEAGIFSNYSKEDEASLKRMIQLSIKNTIDFIRFSFEQAMNSLDALNYKTNVLILEWKFELDLIRLTSKQSSSHTEDKFKEYFDPSIIKQNLLNKAKTDLSMEENRSNFVLWRQYGILKWILNQDNQKMPLKETRKVFDTLLKTSFSSSTNSLEACIDIYSICIDYVELELGMFNNQFDVVSSSLRTSIEPEVNLATVFCKSEFSNLRQEPRSLIKDKDLNSLKFNLSEILANNCLNKNADATKTKSKCTFQIGVNSSTKILLSKRDFELEYERIINDYKFKREKMIEKLNELEIDYYYCSNDDENAPYFKEIYLMEKKIFLYHQVYTLFLLCINSTEKVFEVNEKLIKEPILQLYHSRLIEFYVSLLNYYFYQEFKITKFMYKTKLFSIIHTFTSKSCGVRSLLRVLQTTLIKLKLSNSTLFCSQLLENNDIDLTFNQLGASLSNSSSMIDSSNSSSFYLSLIFTLLNKFGKLESVDNKYSYSPSSLGIHNNIRRIFDHAVKLNPESLQLWIYYLKFEVKMFECEEIVNKKKLEHFKNKITFIYYQSIRNLPYSKVNIYNHDFLNLCLIC